MKLSVTRLRAYAPGLPEDAEQLRTALDEAGIEVKSFEPLPDGDAVVSVELLANRGDHRCYAGVAREVAARLDAARTVPPVEELATTDGGASVRVLADGCLAYTLTPLDLLDDTAPLPGEVRVELGHEGGLTGSSVVDATNAVSLEFGQPTHAFDADTLVGAVAVRQSREGETARLLGETTDRELPPGTLVIADDVKILAVAGVIGCEESRVTGSTRRVLLESATFDPVEVRKSASALGVQTSASQRFERGGDPTLPLVGAGRVARLLEESGAAKVSGPTLVGRAWDGGERVISVDFDDLGDFLGVSLPADEIVDRLARYELRHLGDGRFRVPGHRIWDLVEAQDLYEEVGRNIGYDNLPTTLPSAGVGAAETATEVGLRLAGNVLVSQGFYEIFTDGFYNRDLLRRLGVEPGTPLEPHVATANAADRRYALLKNNCLAQAVEVVEGNLRYRTDEIRLFEATTVFLPEPGADNGVCEERHVLWAVAAGSLVPHKWVGDRGTVDFYFVKGVAEEIAESLQRSLTVAPLGQTDHPLRPYLHPHRSALVSFDGAPVGVLGEVHPEVLERFGIRGARPVYLELDTDALERGPVRSRPSLEESPPIERMLDFVMPSGVSSAEVERVLVEAAPERLRALRVADVFADAELFGAGARSVTYLLLLAAEPTPTSETLNAEVQVMIDAVERQLGDRGVRLR